MGEKVQKPQSWSFENFGWLQKQMLEGESFSETVNRIIDVLRLKDQQPLPIRTEQVEQGENSNGGREQGQ